MDTGVRTLEPRCSWTPDQVRGDGSGGPRYHPVMTDPDYLSGFGNHFATEALPGALPEGRNSPQRPAFGLYAEQLSGTAFTAPRQENRRSWLYRLRPTADHRP